MKITAPHNAQTIKRSVKVEDGPVLEQGTSNTGKKFRVEFIMITYTWSQSHGWDVQHVDVSGNVLKKDGTPSQAFTKQWAYNWDKPGSQYHVIAPVILGLRPVGNVGLPSENAITWETS